MLKIIGSMMIISAGTFFSHTLCTSQRKKLSTTDALIDFTEYIRSSIYTSRQPLLDIYASFKDTRLSECGFIFQLNQNGIRSAINIVSKDVTERSFSSLENLAENLGGINTETQLKLCEETSKLLREELKKQEDMYSKKEKMYKTLPLLMASSIIIMMI